MESHYELKSGNPFSNLDGAFFSWSGSEITIDSADLEAWGIYEIRIEYLRDGQAVTDTDPQPKFDLILLSPCGSDNPIVRSFDQITLHYI